MSNYPEDNGAHPQQSAGPGTGYDTAPPPHVGGPPPAGGAAYQQTSQFPEAPQQQQWAGTSSPGYAPRPGRRSVSVKSSLKTTEFWVFVVVSLGLLIAAAVTDDVIGPGFGAQEAWKYVMILAVGYMISRGLTKLGGREEDTDSSRH